MRYRYITRLCVCVCVTHLHSHARIPAAKTRILYYNRVTPVLHVFNTCKRLRIRVYRTIVFVRRIPNLCSVLCGWLDSYLTQLGIPRLKVNKLTGSSQIDTYLYRVFKSQFIRELILFGEKVENNEIKDYELIYTRKGIMRYLSRIGCSLTMWTLRQPSWYVCCL